MPEQNGTTTGPDAQVSVTADQLAEKAETLDDLRAQIAAEREKRAAAEYDQVNATTAVQLDAEEARLRAELAAEQALTKKVESQTNSSVVSAKEAMRAALAHQQATEELIEADEKAAQDARHEATPNPLIDGGEVPVVAPVTEAQVSTATEAAKTSPTGTTTKGK